MRHLFIRLIIGPIQIWLTLNYSFVRIQNSLMNLVRDNKFFTIILCLKNDVTEAILNENERKAAIFAKGLSDVNCNKSWPTIRHCLYVQYVGP